MLKELHYGVVEMDGDHVTKSSNISPISLQNGNFSASSMMRSDYNEWLDERLAHYIEFGKANDVACVTGACFFQQTPTGFAQTCFGPWIENVHTINETLHIEDVKPVLMTTVFLCESSRASRRFRRP